MIYSVHGTKKFGTTGICSRPVRTARITVTVSLLIWLTTGTSVEEHYWPCVWIFRLWFGGPTTWTPP